MSEEWRPVVGYDGIYSVSSDGRVRSESRCVNHPTGGTVLLPMRVLTPGRMGVGYSKVTLCRNGNEVYKSVHRLVAEAFIGPCPYGMQVAHDDGDKTNNKKSNLRYDTKKGNEADKLRHGTLQRGESSRNAKLTELQVLQIRSAIGSVKQIGEAFGVSPQTAWKVRTRKSWAHVSTSP